MIIPIKKIIYLIVMIAVVADCYGGEGQGNGYVPNWPGNYVGGSSYDPAAHGIAHFPVAPYSSSSPVEPVYIQNNSYQSQLFQQYQTEQEEEKKRKAELEREDAEFARQLVGEWYLESQQHQEQTDAVQQQKNNDCTNAKGVMEDRSAFYTNSWLKLYSIGQTIQEKFSRISLNSHLFIVRCGNTYQNVYEEANTNTTLGELALFNTYKAGKIIRNINSSRSALSIGDVVCGKEDHTRHNSTNYSPSISRNQLTALLITSMLFKSGVTKALLTAVGITMPGVFVLPIMIAGSMVIPIVAIIGGSLTLIGFVGLVLSK